MKTAVIGCPTIRDEVEAAEKEVRSGYDFYWLGKNLHDFPQLLNKAIQEILDGLTGYDKVLLTFGICGNALLGLRTNSFSLIAPRIDDCISMMLGSFSRRKAIVEEHQCLFLTRGWLENERGMWDEYTHTIDKFGEEDAKGIFSMMYHDYKALHVLDTGAYDVERVLPKVKRLASCFEMTYDILPAGIERLTALLRGPWDEIHYIIVPPGSILEAKDLSF